MDDARRGARAIGGAAVTDVSDVINSSGVSDAADPSTSLQRTYRYLRIAIAGTVVVIFVAIAVTIPVVGVLPSLSHYYYTPAGVMFVGALIAASVCLFALSGRGVERALLDAAAVVVPLMAIVPTVISPGSIAGIDVTCRGACVPDAYGADIDSAVATYLILGAMILGLALALVIAGQVDRRAAMISVTVAGAILATVWLTWWLARDAFLQWAHFAAAIGFFVVIAAVAFVNAFFPPTGPVPTRWLRVAYVGIAVALLGDIAALSFISLSGVGQTYGIFAGEVLALLLFIAYWVLQSIQNWNDPDPAGLRARFTGGS